MDIHGACHCGNIHFSLAWPHPTTTISARVCTCTFCRKHGASWTAHADASLRVSVRDPDDVSHYRFGSHTAEFHVCARCGVVILATSRIDDRLYAVVNTNAFECTALTIEQAPVSFDGEPAPARSERRKKGWLRNAEFVVDKGRGEESPSIP